MRNLARMLAFSAVLLAAAGCPKKTGEEPGPGDAASPAGATEAAREALADAGPLPSLGPDAGAADAGLEGGTVAVDGGVRGGATSATADGGVRSGATSATADGGAAAAVVRADAGGGKAASVEQCVDAWLAQRKLNRYGDPEGTMYAGGTPLFDERTGERRDRLAHVMQKHPAVRDACGAPPATRDAQ